MEAPVPIDWWWMALKILAVILLVGLNGFFVAAEFALVKTRQTQLKPLVEEGQGRAKVAHFIIDNLDAFPSACQLGITLASLALGWIGEPIFETLLEPVFHWLAIESETARSTISFGVGFSIITILHIVVGEIAPKSLAIQKPLPTSLWVAYPMMWFYRMSYPFVAILNWASQLLLKVVGIGTAQESHNEHSEEELRLLVASNKEQAKRSRLGRDIVMNALDLGNRIAREAMQPRTSIVGLDTNAGIEECVRIAGESNFSRFPLCEDDDLDRTIGVVHIKDIYGRRNRAKRAADLLPASRKIIYVPETCRLEKILQLFLERKLHFAIVVDEFGGTVGMITLEDVLEELVGEIQDEFDQEIPQLKQLDDGTWEASGMLPVHELEDLVGESVLEEGISTISGLLTQRLGGFPKEGDKLEVGEFEIEVTETAGPKVEKVKFSRKK
ncbi:MAG: HlyC/CorC family transporter [Verrucomicrobia bacterium]|nr:HlyC/CorC family transporter [Verrucomicrobiota bacterium]